MVPDWQDESNTHDLWSHTIELCDSPSHAFVEAACREVALFI